MWFMNLSGFRSVINFHLHETAGNTSLTFKFGFQSKNVQA